MNIQDVQKVIVIGAGGTGSILLPQLARYLRSQDFHGKLIIVDGDTYSESNAERQLFALSKIGLNKAEYQNAAIVSQLPDMEDTVEFLDEYIGKDDIDELVNDFTVVINCVDNNAVRKYVEDRCATLNDAAHICCGNEMYTGQVQISLRRDGKWIKPTIFAQSPNFNSTNNDRSTMDCQQIAALPGGGQLICANMMAAAFALGIFIQLTFGADMHLGGTYIPAGYVEYNVYTSSVSTRDFDKPDLAKIAKYKAEKKKVNLLETTNA